MLGGPAVGEAPPGWNLASPLEARRQATGNPESPWKEVQYAEKVGMPRGRSFPPVLGMYTRRTGHAANVSDRRASPSLARFLSRSASKSLMHRPSHPAVLLPAFCETHAH